MRNRVSLSTTIFYDFVFNLIFVIGHPIYLDYRYGKHYGLSILHESFIMVLGFILLTMWNFFYTCFELKAENADVKSKIFVFALSLFFYMCFIVSMELGIRMLPNTFDQECIFSAVVLYTVTVILYGRVISSSRK